MIEGPGGPAPSKSPLRGWSPGALLEQLRGGFDGLRRRLSPPPPQHERGDVLLARLRLAERIMWVVLIGLGAYLATDVFVLQLKPPKLAAIPAGSGAAATAEEPSMKPLVEYRQTLADRNPFALAVHAVAGVAPSGPQAKSKLEELVGGLTVVGINRGRVPEALIEDAKATRTYFVKIGDDLNGLKVKAIDQNGVTVTYEGEETTLK